MDIKMRPMMEALLIGLSLAVLLLLLSPAAGAQPADETFPPPQPDTILANGFITGVVTGDDTSAPMANVQVCANRDSPYVYQCAYTDATGVYSVSVPAGSYRVMFWPSDYHIPEYYDNVPYSMYNSYTPVEVTDDTVTPNINAGLAAGMQIIGYVTDETTSDPLSGISIYGDEPNGAYYAYGYTGADGVYTTTPGFPAGSYRVKFTDYAGVYAAEYYANTYRPALATLVNLTNTSRSDIDAALARATVITGVVTGPGPLNGITVYAYFADENTYANSTNTNASGVYRLSGLAPLSYKVWFYDYSGQHLSEWHQDKPDWNTADPILLTSGVTTTINADLAQAGVISGTITVEGSGTPLANIYVRAYNAATGSSTASSYTDAGGVYRIGGLTTGAYKLRFRDNNGVYLTEYYDNRPTLDSADPITVTAGITTLVNAQLTPAGIITGVVTNEDDHLPLANISVTAYDAATGNSINSGNTDASGVYRIGGLTAGNYKLHFYDNQGDYLSEYYDNKPNPTTADPVMVTTGMTTTADAQLARAGIVSGRVTAEDSGLPLAYIGVSAYDAMTSNYVGDASTDASGVYRLGRLATGQYKLYLYDYTGVYLNEYYDNKFDFDSANPVTVTAGMTATADVQLARAGFVGGTVTDETTDLPLADINVTAYDAVTGNFVNNDGTDAAGIYRIGGLATGQYKVYLYDNHGVYLGEYYDNKADFTAADPVMVTGGMTATVDAQLMRAAVITGVVTAAATGLPLDAIDVNAYNAVTGNYIGDADTNGSGIYRIGGLASGHYKLYFRDYDGIYLGEYYNDKRNLADADPVTTTAGMTTTVNATLARAGVIQGMITAEGSGSPLEAIDVNVYDAATGNYINDADTDADGIYRLGGLATGQYKLYFRDYDGLYLGEYYNDRLNLSGADPVTVTAELTTTVNAALAPAGMLSGVVTEESTGLPLEDIDVNVYNALTGNYIDDRDTDADGFFRMGGLTSGPYKLYFRDRNGVYLDEYYDDKSDLASADPITVTAGLTTTLEAALGRGGRITGRVTDADSGAGIANVQVWVNRQDGDSPSGSADTDVQGYYTTSALYTGVYRVEFNPPQPYYGEYYDNFRQWDNFTAVTVTAPLTTTGVDAALQTGYIITGIVSGSGPLRDVYVMAYRAADSYSWAGDYTGSDGEYRLGPLDPGAYRVYFQSGDWHAGEWYNDSASYRDSALINVTNNVTDINASLTGGGRIMGAVTGAGGAPLPDVWVYVYPAGNSSSVASGETDAAGHYVTAPGLPTGEYQVKFSAPLGHNTEWYNDQSGQTTAARLAVTSGLTVTGVNAQLTAYTWGSITGTITAADTGQPLSMWVYAYNSQGNSIRSVYASGGAYTLDYLPPDVYRVYFSASEPYLSTYYDTRPNLSSADRVTVPVGTTIPHINQAIPRGGNITGTVTRNGSDGIPGVYVYAERITGSWASRSTYTGVDGAYRLDGLPDGGYKVQFTPPSPFIGEWYDDTPLESAAEIVTVTLADTTPNVDATLAAGGIITGRVTAADTGAPLPGVYVNVYSITGSFMLGAYADRDGYYRTPGLPAGDYQVLFDIGPWLHYRSEWYSDAHAQSDCITVTVSASGAASHIDAALERGGSISGWTYSKVTGQALNSVYVVAYSTPAYTYVNYDYSNDWGFYQVNGLPADQYKVYFSRSSYKAQWYERAVDFTSALTVTVSVPDDTPNVNVYLRYPYEVYLPIVLRSKS